MTKKHFALIFIGLAVVVSCLLILSSNASQLPPNVVRPSAKPAISTGSDKQKLAVTTDPESQAAIALSPDKTEKTTSPHVAVTAQTTAVKPKAAINCNSPTTAKSAKPASSLAATTTVQNADDSLMPITHQLNKAVLDISDILN